MAKHGRSRKRYKANTLSLKGDTHHRLLDVLRKARLNRQISQQSLARKLGLGQRQISDLERAVIDPRLSTIQSVGGALDLELMFVPRHLISAVESLQRADSPSAKRPMYRLGDENAESNPTDRSNEEAGIDEPENFTESGRHQPKELQ